MRCRIPAEIRNDGRSSEHRHAILWLVRAFSFCPVAGDDARALAGPGLVWAETMEPQGTGQPCHHFRHSLDRGRHEPQIQRWDGLRGPRGERVPRAGKDPELCDQRGRQLSAREQQGARLGADGDMGDAYRLEVRLFEAVAALDRNSSTPSHNIQSASDTSDRFRQPVLTRVHSFLAPPLASKACSARAVSRSLDAPLALRFSAAGPSLVSM